jgi:hypothetical protein
MPILYQFQYQDSLAMNPATLKGIRRYELLLLSRRPKPEAFEMMKLIERYGPPDSAVRRIGVSHEVVEMTGDTARVEFALENHTDELLTLKVRPEAPTEMTAANAGTGEVVLQPKASARVPVTVAFAAGKQRRPGFYHVFLRIEGADDMLRYGWAEVRKAGQPQIDKGSGDGKVVYADGALDFNLNRPLTVVYTAEEKSVAELEAAWTVFITLESATGRPADIYQASDLAKLPDRDERTIVLVTREKGAKPSVRVEGGNKLVVTGGDEKAVTAACMDFVVRYWMTAKDSGGRKVGLVAAPAGEGGVKTDLD